MTSTGSVTRWLDGLRAGNDADAERLWKGYWARLVRLAQVKLAGRRRTLDGPEDVALSAFNSFCLAARRGRFPKLNDRHDLWQLLVMLTERKVIDQVRRAGARPAVEMDDFDPEAPAPSPSHVARVVEEFERRLAQLATNDLRDIALLKLAEHTNAEIAEKIGKSLATVERKLALIRLTWEKVGADD